MSAPTSEVEAAQPVAVGESTTQETVAKLEEPTKQEESASKTEETTADSTGDVKVENGTTTEADGEVKKDESKPGPLLKTKAPLQKHKSNKKFDPSVLPVTDDPKAIRSQFEFYFGDSNLPSDKHMWTITGGTENKPVKVKHILSFGRCKRFQSYEAVIAALKDSEHLEVSGPEGDEEVKRKTAYVPSSEAPQARVARSVYVKGFGDETPTTQVDIEAFFAPYGPISAIRLRRTEEEFFKGSVFVEFPSEEAAKAFVALDPAPTYQGHELKIMPKRAYMEEKNQLIKEGKLEPQKQQKAKFWEGKELGGGRGGRGGRGGGGNRNGDSDDWKKRRENDQRNGHGGRGGRGGRGRGGRGGRGRGGRDDRNGRDRRQDAPTQTNTNNVPRPRVNATEPTADNAKKENGKRAREDEGAPASEPPAKKLDTKTEAAPAERND